MNSSKERHVHVRNAGVLLSFFALVSILPACSSPDDKLKALQAEITEAAQAAREDPGRKEESSQRITEANRSIAELAQQEHGESCAFMASTASALTLGLTEVALRQTEEKPANEISFVPLQQAIEQEQMYLACAVAGSDQLSESSRNSVENTLYSSVTAAITAWDSMDFIQRLAERQSRPPTELEIMIEALDAMPNSALCNAFRQQAKMILQQPIDDSIKVRQLHVILGTAKQRGFC